MTQSDQVGRNAPCPCDSGRQYKHCCGSVVSDDKLPPIEESGLPSGLIEAVKKAYENLRRHIQWPLVHGATPPAATALWQGMRLVSAGGCLYEIPVEESWYGFLYGLLIEQIGPEWFDSEMEKPEGSGHFLAQWYHDICRRERDENGHFTRRNPSNEVGTTLAFRSIAYDIFCMMQAINLSPKLLDRLRHPDQFEGARYELWVAATLARAGFSIEFAHEEDRSSKHGEGIATHKETGKKYWIEAKRKHRPAFDYLQALIDKLVLKVDAKLVAAAMQKPAEEDRLIFIDVNRPPWSRSDIKAPWIGAFRESINRLQFQKNFRDNPDQRAFVMVTNHPYHFVSNVRPDPKQHFFGTAFNMPHLNPLTLEADFPMIYALMRSITDHFAIPDDFLERPNVGQG
jgi:hypothetical protein